MKNKNYMIVLLILAALFCPPARAQQILGNPIGLAQTTTTESGHVFKTAPGLLYGLSVTTSASAGYLMVDNVTAVPSDGAVNPFLCYGVAANSSVIIPFAYPVPFSTGITAVFSTTGCNTQTKSATAFFQAQVR